MIFKIDFIRFDNNTDWKHFLWCADINGEKFDFKTGIGHCTTYSHNCKKNKKPENSIIVKCSEAYKQSGFKIWDLDQSNGKVWAHVPEVDDLALNIIVKAEGRD